MRDNGVIGSVRDTDCGCSIVSGIIGSAVGCGCGCACGGGGGGGRAAVGMMVVVAVAVSSICGGCIAVSVSLGDDGIPVGLFSSLLCVVLCSCFLVCFKVTRH